MYILNGVYQRQHLTPKYIVICREDKITLKSQYDLVIFLKKDLQQVVSP